MAGDRIPGVVGTQPRRTPDLGTFSVTRSPQPELTGTQPDTLGDLESALGLLKAETTNFAYRFINDSAARSDYLARSTALAARVRQQVSAGELTPKQAALEVNRVRNEIMQAVRSASSDLGRAYAEGKKATGRTLAELEERYAQKLFSKSFASLSSDNKNRVWLEVVEASGRPQEAATRTARNLGKLGRGLVLASLAFAVYNIAQAENKPRQAAKEAGTFGAGILGGALAGGGAGLACGPGAPACVAVGIFVGGVLAAAGFDLAFDALW
jgi:hypothetical protein